MAIVFISAKAKQTTFLRTTFMVLLVILFVIIAMIFVTGLLNKSQKDAVQQSNDYPNVALNLSIIDSAAFKNLEQFYNLENDFTYVVTDKNGRKIQGSISAANEEEARILLESSGYQISTLQEMKAGRSEPFAIY